jgi:RND superfamily putative drug exporter
MLLLDGLLRRRRGIVLIAWAAVLIAAVPFAARQSEDLSSGGFDVPGSQSAEVAGALDRFPGVARAQLAAVLVPAPGAGPEQLAAAVDRVAAAAGPVDGVSIAAGARDRAAAQVGGGTVVVPLRAEVDEDGATEVAVDLRDRLGIGDGPRDGVTTHLVGQGALWAGMQELSKEDLAKAESAGFPVVLIILLFVFGSLAAAALPLALGFVSVLVTGALIFALSQVMEMSVFVTNMASMIGIGVAVDYSLFIVARYREEVAAGRDPADARAVAMATSGLAVLFSGLTVIISLAGLWMIDNTAIRSMALGAMLVVGVAILAATTLLPVLIRLLGHRAHTRGRLFGAAGRLRRRRAARPAGAPDFWQRWTDGVMRRPVLAVAGTTAVLLALAAPVLGMTTGTGALDQFPRDHETRQGFEAAAARTGPGASAPIQVVVRGEDPETLDAAAARVGAALADDPGVARVAEPVAARDGGAVLVGAEPRADGEAPSAHAAVDRLRVSLPAVAGPGATVDVGGVTASQGDMRDLVSGSMWKILLFLLGLSYLVLLVLLRSVVLPLKAVLVNLLSVGAAFGVLSLAYDQVDTLTPPLVLAVVFGLSMDYEVFLLSRIRERYEATGDTRTAVAQGLAASARTITSAAVIMVAVFGVFVAVGVPSIQQIGVGTAVAIALDATLVRLILVPAAMELLGDWNWYLPRSLARVLPRTELESVAPQPAR